MIDKCCLKFTGEVVVFGSGTASQCCDHQIGLQGADMKGRFIGPSIAGCRYGRTGSLWEGRYRATVLDPVAYFVPCAHLIESQPVSAGLVPEAAVYPWSSHAHHIGHRKESWLTDHPAYWALGNTPFEREAAYQQVSASPPDVAMTEKVLLATRKAWALGSEEFCRRLAKLTVRRLAPARRGRPRKAGAESLPEDSPATGVQMARSVSGPRPAVRKKQLKG